jgi:hypothetical protein
MYKDVVNNLNLFDIKYPKTIVPTPTEDDYAIGFINRYFVQKVNDENAHIFEIDEKEYDAYVDNLHWKTAQLKWRITGPKNTIYNLNGGIDDKGVIDANKSAISRTSQKLKNIGLYLPNVLQFHK